MAGLALTIGATVKAVVAGGKEHEGILRYLGPVEGTGSNVTWAGIELPGPTGKNNGSAKGKEYFRCPDLHGLFVKESSVTLRSQPSKKRNSTLRGPSQSIEAAPQFELPERIAKSMKAKALQCSALEEELARTTKQLQDAQNELKASRARIEQSDHAHSSQLESELELAKLDKEMAEEQLDLVQQELESIKSKNEELEVEIEVLRDENKELGSTMTDEERNNAGWIHLERERDRLKEALLLLRDHKQEMEIEYKHEIENLQSDLETTEETAIKYLETAESLNRAEDLNQNLREQLEAAENQEDLIATMMQERDNHLAQIQDLQNTLADLEDLAATNEDLEQMYLEQQKDLNQKVDMCELENHELQEKTDAQSQMVENLEYTLNKMRSMVQNLQADIDEAHRSKEISELQANELSTKSRAMMDLNIKLQNSAGKSQNRAIETDLMKAQVKLQAQQLSIVSLFLPDTFDSERPAITALLSFGRLKLKAATAANVLSERLRDRAHLHDAQQMVSAYNVLAPIRSIQYTAHRLEQFMSSCSPIEFASFIHINQDLEPVERAVTLWLETLKNDELNADNFDNMNRMDFILYDMSEKLINNSLESTAAGHVCEVKIAAAYVEVAASVLDWLHDTISTDDESFPALKRLSASYRTIRVACNKLFAELEKRKDHNICVDEEVLKLQDFCNQTKSIFTSTIDLCQSVSAQTGSEPLQAYEQELVTLTEASKNIVTSAELISHKVFNNQSDLPFEPNPAPWIVRAKELKAQKQMSIDALQELAQSVRQNQELAARISDKERQIEELSIRAEFAEKRVKETRSKEAHDKELKDEIGHLQKAKTDLDSELATIRAELLALQEENKKDKAELSALRSVSETPTGVHTPISSTAGPSSDLLTTRIQSLLTQINDLQATVRHLKRENYQLTVPTSKTRMDALLRLGEGSRKGENIAATTTAEKKRREARTALLHITDRMKIVQLKENNFFFEEPRKWKSVLDTSAWNVARNNEIWAAYVARE